MVTALAILLIDDVATAAPTLCGRPALDWLLDTVTAIGPDALTVSAPTGTTAAVRDRISAHPALSGLPAAAGADEHITLVLRCSMPLVRPAVLRRAIGGLRAAASRSARAVIVGSVPEEPWWVDEPTVRRPVALALAGSGNDVVRLVGALGRGSAAVQRALGDAGIAACTEPANPVESLSLNHPVERVRIENALYQRIAAGWLARGVRIDDPARTRIDAMVQIGEGAHIHPDTELTGTTVIGRGSEIGPATTIRDSRIGADCLVQYAVCQHVEVGDNANVGPYCWLRSGTRLGARARAGSFVELADSVVGEDSSIPHLGGLMSADVGRGCNIAGLSGPANFDGTRKHRVQIGDYVSIGAGTILIAPVAVGDRAQTAAGSVITKDVPSGALAAARAEQRNFAGWTADNRAGSAAARAAERTADHQRGASAATRPRQRPANPKEGAHPPV